MPINLTKYTKGHQSHQFSTRPIKDKIKGTWDWVLMCDTCDLFICNLPAEHHRALWQNHWMRKKDKETKRAKRVVANGVDVKEN